jgi:hypothetical protein
LWLAAGAARWRPAPINHKPRRTPPVTRDTTWHLAPPAVGRGRGAVCCRVAGRGRWPQKKRRTRSAKCEVEVPLQVEVDKLRVWVAGGAGRRAPATSANGLGASYGRNAEPKPREPGPLATIVLPPQQSTEQLRWYYIAARRAALCFAYPPTTTRYPLQARRLATGDWRGARRGRAVYFLLYTPDYKQASPTPSPPLPSNLARSLSLATVSERARRHTSTKARKKRFS